MLLPPETVLDHPMILARLDGALEHAKGHPDARPLRAIAGQILAEVKAAANATLEAAFLKQPLTSARDLTHSQARLTDDLVGLALPGKITPWAESLIESVLYLLWDLKLKVGHSSRTVKDCLKLGRGDFTIRTALLEHRFISGDAKLAKELDDRLWADLTA